MNSQTTNKKGFTIIEVVLVLAIAGLIFLMVFLALPALQRSQRDTARKNDLSRLVAALNDYKAAHRGKIPEDGKWQEMVNDYLLGGNTSNARGSFIDPSGPASTGDGSSENSYFLRKAEVATGALSATFEESQNIIYYTPGARCAEGGADIVGNQGQRVVTFRIKLENAGWHCVDN